MIKEETLIKIIQKEEYNTEAIQMISLKLKEKLTNMKEGMTKEKITIKVEDIKEKKMTFLIKDKDTINKKDYRKRTTKILEWKLELDKIQKNQKNKEEIIKGTRIGVKEDNKEDIKIIIKGKDILMEGRDTRQEKNIKEDKEALKK